MRFERQTFWLPRPAKWLIPAAAMVAFVLWYNRDRTASAVSLSRLQQAGAVSNWAVVRSDGYRYLKQHPADDEAILWVARAEASDSQFDKSLRLLAKVPASSPRSAEARLREGQSQRQLFHAVAAERSFTEAVEQGLASGAPPSVVDSARLGLVQLYATEARNTEA